MCIAIYVEMKLMIITDISNKTCHSYLNKKLIMTFFIIFMNLLGCANNEEAPEDAFINDIVNAYDSAKTIKNSHHLRHRCHSDFCCRNNTYNRTNRNSADHNVNHILA